MLLSALTDLDQASLTPIVRAALDSPRAEVTDWQVNPIIQGKASSAGVSRIIGTAEVEGSTRAWSLVVKWLEASSQSAFADYNARSDPNGDFYWKRELLLYQSGLFEKLPNGLAAPRYYQIDEAADGWRIWMEDVREDLGPMWPLDHYRNVGRHFGRMSGLYVTPHPLPPWLLTNYFARWLEDSDWPDFAAAYPALRQKDSLVQLGWSDALFDRVDRILQERDQFLQGLNQLPQTFQHNDSGRKNLIARRRPDGEIETVALDWGQAAIGAIGGELACIISQPVYWFLGVRPDDLPYLDSIAFEGYLRGLRDVGWQGDADAARLGYTASMALRGSFGNFTIEWVVQNEETRKWIETAIGHPIEEIVAVLRGFRSYVVACADEARQLMGTAP